MSHQPLTDSIRNPGVATVASVTRAALMRQRCFGLAVYTLILVACFYSPLFSLLRFALNSSLYSHIVLIPFIAAYLAWLKRAELFPALATLLKNAPGEGTDPAEHDRLLKTPCRPRALTRRAGTIPIVMGIALVAVFWAGPRFAWQPVGQDYLGLMAAAFLCFFVGGVCVFFGSAVLCQLWFPLAFVVFMVPFPAVVESRIEQFLQHCSAYAAASLLSLSGMPVFHQGTWLQLPGFSMQVAPECSGIHSTLVLVITALLAGHLLLNRPSHIALLAIVIVPLGILRNAFRILVIGQLCVRLNPNWINSDLHHRGGPIFFLLSLIPFFLLLLWLRRLEARQKL